MSQFSECRNLTDLQTAIMGCRPPRLVAAEAPCSEPYITGTNVILDPGFELHAASTGRTELPERTGFDYPYELQYIDNSYEDWRKIYWSTYSHGWDLSTLNPDTGTYHARWYSASGTTGPLLSCDQRRMCSEPIGGWEPTLHTCRVNPGDLIEVSFRARGTNGMNFQSLVDLWGIDGSFGSYNDISLTTSVTTTWTTYSYSGVTSSYTGPDQVGFAMWQIRGMGSGIPGAFLEIDNVSMVVS